MASNLSFLFRGKRVPVSFLESVTSKVAHMALYSEVFQTWSDRCEKGQRNKQIDIHSVEIQHVDMFGTKVGFVKIKADCTLVDGITNYQHRLPGICFLRGGSVAILVALICAEEGGKVYSLLVEQPRVPVGQASCLELPAGMIDSVNDGIAGTAAKEMEEECGIKLRPSDLTDLTELAFSDSVEGGSIPYSAIAPSPGGCDEFMRYLYLERRVAKRDLDMMRERLAGLQKEGEYITLKVVLLSDLWKVSADNKAICAQFLSDKLRKDGKLPPLGGLVESPCDPTLRMNDDRVIPTLAFGMYKIPGDSEGLKILMDAISVGYRHFDTASLYKNERILGEAIRQSRIPREDFFVCSKVWNDAQKEGPEAVRRSVEASLRELNCDYFDIMYVHWPVPGRFIDTYKVLQEIRSEGSIRNIGISNFGIAEYEELMSAEGITVPPVVNQIEISPFMYRPETLHYFQERGVSMVASKALHRASGLEEGVVSVVARSHRVTPAQVLIRWGIQKGLIVVAKTSNSHRMVDNRGVLEFSLTDEEIHRLDSLTSDEQIRGRENLELQRRNDM